MSESDDCKQTSAAAGSSSPPPPTTSDEPKPKDESNPCDSDEDEEEAKLSYKLVSLESMDDMCTEARSAEAQARRFFLNANLTWTEGQIDSCLLKMDDWLCRNCGVSSSKMSINARAVTTSELARFAYPRMCLLYAKLWSTPALNSDIDWRICELGALYTRIQALIASLYTLCVQSPPERTLDQWRSDVSDLDRYTCRWIVEMTQKKSLNITSCDDMVAETVMEGFELAVQYIYWLRFQIKFKSRCTIEPSRVSIEMTNDFDRFLQSEIFYNKPDPGSISVLREHLYCHWMTCGSIHQYIRAHPQEETGSVPLVVFEAITEEKLAEERSKSVDSISDDVRVAFNDADHPLRDLVCFFSVMEFIAQRVKRLDDFRKNYYVSQFDLNLVEPLVYASQSALTSKASVLMQPMRCGVERRPIIVCILGRWCVLKKTNVIVECASAVLALQTWIQLFRDDYKCRNERGHGWATVVMHMIPSSKAKLKRRRKRQKPAQPKAAPALGDISPLSSSEASSTDDVSSE